MSTCACSARQSATVGHRPPWCRGSWRWAVGQSATVRTSRQDRRAASPVSIGGKPISADRIVITGLELYGYHGVYPAERTLGQRFIVDLTLVLDLRDAGQRDDLTATIDYGHVCQAVRRIVEGEPLHLIEAVAERIAAAILAAYPVASATVRVHKPSAPIANIVVRDIVVEITRQAARPG